MACAFGMEACKHYYSVRYIRLPDLLLDLQAARDNGTFSTVLKKYTKPIVLIIDEWLLLKLTVLLISQLVINQICSHVTDLPSFVSLLFLYNPADFLPDYLFHLQCYI